MSAMDPETYVREIYRLVLGREADPDGLKFWVSNIVATADPTIALAGLLRSEEYRRRFSLQDWLDPNLLSSCLRAVGEQTLTIVDVGAQMLSNERHIYEPLIASGASYWIIGFEPLEDKLTERREAEDGRSLTLLPYAIADGRQHTLYVNNDNATSSLFPLNKQLCSEFEHLHTLRLDRQVQVETYRLDDVLPDAPVAFLKLDIQGAELLALRSAQRTLARTAVVHCEVEFSALYEGQPLYPEVQMFLNEHGFDLIDIIVQHRYAYLTPSERVARDRILWGDAVFFRGTDDSRMLAMQALISLLVYQKPTLSEHLLTRSRSVNLSPRSNH